MSPWISTGGQYSDEADEYNRSLIEEDERLNRKTATFYVPDHLMPYVYKHFGGSDVSLDNAQQVAKPRQFGQSGTVTEVTISGEEANLESLIKDLRDNKLIW